MDNDERYVLNVWVLGCNSILSFQGEIDFPQSSLIFVRKVNLLHIIYYLIFKFLLNSSDGKYSINRLLYSLTNYTTFLSENVVFTSSYKYSAYPKKCSTLNMEGQVLRFWILLLFSSADHSAWTADTQYDWRHSSNFTMQSKWNSQTVHRLVQGKWHT